MKQLLSSFTPVYNAARATVRSALHSKYPSASHSKKV